MQGMGACPSPASFYPIPCLYLSIPIYSALFSTSHPPAWGPVPLTFLCFANSYWSFMTIQASRPPAPAGVSQEHPISFQAHSPVSCSLLSLNPHPHLASWCIRNSATGTTNTPLHSFIFFFFKFK